MTPAEFHDQALERARRVLVDADEPFRFLLAALVTGGNVLVEGVPGTAKTLMARALAALLAPAAPGETGEPGKPADPGAGGHASLDTQHPSLPTRTFQRIQLTPDVMPSDILGTNVFHAPTATFSFRPGPIFASVVVADEVNRAPAKTQSALLEAMEERQVTVEGQRMALPPVFLVVATQNPVEFEGTYPLPEAQLDRFLFKLLVGYGSAEAEAAVLRLHHQGFEMAADLTAAGVTPLADGAAVLDLRRQVQAVRLEDSVAGYIVAVERATRTAPEAQYGASVRGAIGLLNAGKALAAFAGRDYVSPDDVKAAAAAVLRHRLILKPEAELDGVTPDHVIGRILATLPVPR